MWLLLARNPIPIACSKAIAVLHQRICLHFILVPGLQEIVKDSKDMKTWEWTSFHLVSYIVGTSTIPTPTKNVQQEQKQVWDSHHFFRCLILGDSECFIYLYINCVSETVPATRYQSWNARGSVPCSPLSASCRPIDVPGSLSGTSVGAAFGWSCTSRPRKWRITNWQNRKVYRKHDKLSKIGH